MAIKSFRLAQELEVRVRQAATLRGVSESEFVREALERAVESELEARRAIVDSIRELSVKGRGEPVARRTHEAFGEIVAARRDR
jgi:predicted DNA-binding protein